MLVFLAVYCLTLFRMVPQNPLLPPQDLTRISYNDETWHSYTLLKEDPISNVGHPLSSADINISSPEISKFCYIKKYRYRLHFGT